MSFNTLKSDNYINIKLTDEGRHQLSLGKLNFSKMILSDREIDYSIDYSNNYLIDSNRVLSPIDSQPNIDAFNLDGSDPIALSSNLIASLKQFITGDTVTTGFFSGKNASNQWTILEDKQKNRSDIAFIGQSWGDSTLIYTGPPVPSSGDLIFIPWLAPQYSNGAIPSSYPAITSGTPFNGLWYRIISGSTPTFGVDRPIPDFGNIAHQQATFYYPFNGPEEYYGSGATQNPNVCNMNIVRTYNVAGIDTNIQGVSGFSYYGSLQYAGTKQYFGFSSDTPAVGFIHYTNGYTGDTYGEQLIEKSIELHIPFIMWHKFTGYTNGQALGYGMSCYDYYGETKYDPYTKSTYRDLRDGTTSGNSVVGRVYHKLKMAVITDQEVLNALSYKSNRNYTYPDPIVELTTVPAPNTPYYSVSGLCESGKTYFVTLLFENEKYNATTSFGYPPSIHSGYIKKIKGENDIHGNPKFLKISFPSNSFPYMRNDAWIASGTGWNANTVQVLVNEQPNENNYETASVPPNQWMRVSSATTGGNGIYKASDVGDNTIDPVKLNAHEFVISRQDLQTGSTYVLATGMTVNPDVLNFGDESFFFGVFKSQTIRTKYLSSIVGYVLPHELNSSTNPTFESLLNNATYVSEIAVLDSNNLVVAIGKPTRPLKKEVHRMLAVQLLLEF